MKEYRTFAGDGAAELVEKRSRFLAEAHRVTTEEDALRFLAEAKSRYWDARHHVYAYTLRDNNITRFSDDGEPSKTAGPPVLDVLLREGITDAVIIVTRYFGGTLLGTGGLVQAYGKSAKMALDDAGIARMVPCMQYETTVSYSDWGKLQKVLEKTGADTPEAEFGAEITARFRIPLEQEQTMLQQLTEQFNARLTVTPVGQGYVQMDSGR